MSVYFTYIYSFRQQAFLLCEYFCVARQLVGWTSEDKEMSELLF